MGKYPESRTRGLVKIEPLKKGEQSAVYRVRGPDQLHRWLADMTAEQRGRLLSAVMLASVTPVDTKAGEMSTDPRPHPGRPARAAAPAEAKPLTGKGAELYALLQSGGEMVADGARYVVRKDGEIVATFAGATGGALLTRAGLLVRTSGGAWTAAPGLLE